MTSQVFEIKLSCNIANALIRILLCVYVDRAGDRDGVGNSTFSR